MIVQHVEWHLSSQLRLPFTQHLQIYSRTRTLESTRNDEAHFQSKDFQEHLELKSFHHTHFSDARHLYTQMSFLQNGTCAGKANLQLT